MNKYIHTHIVRDMTSQDEKKTEDIIENEKVYKHACMREENLQRK